MQMETREQWLNAAVEVLRSQDFSDLGETVPQVRVSTGFPKGNVRKVIGQCWNNTEDGVSQIFITPTIDEPLRVLDILVHELIHAMTPGAGHKGPFKRIATDIGLEGKMTATHAGEALKSRLAEIVEQLGPYPHRKLSLQDGRKKQGTRMGKVACGECGYTARTTRKWLELSGPPICPCNMEPMQTEPV